MHEAGEPMRERLTPEHLQGVGAASATPRVHTYQYWMDHAALAVQVPNLIGAKHEGSDTGGLLSSTALAQQRSPFTGEHACSPFASFGPQGYLRGMAGAALFSALPFPVVANRTRLHALEEVSRHATHPA